MIKRQTKNKVSRNKYVVSYLTLRKLIGVIAILLPVILPLGSLINGCNQLLISISDYYHTAMRNIFVGALFAVSFFMFSYKGRKTSIWWLRENLFSNIGGMLVLLVALFPTINSCKVSCNVPISYLEQYKLIFGVIHNISAVLFFSVLVYFCLVLFKEKDELIYCGNNLINVKKRNLIYKICGYTMLFSICLTLLFFIISKSYNLSCHYIQTYDLVFWTELTGLWAFGVSWLIKGQVCWKDNN